ncbi:MAG: hypothetical protein H6737_06360 [Alphaproteobacteria bacterium]|nr:hypothetical protein [Alphaproteobacteria bacterium]
MLVVQLLGCVGAMPESVAVMPQRRVTDDIEAMGERAPDRLVTIDLEPWGRRGAEVVAYSAFEVLRPVKRENLALQSELSVAVRLVLSEVGPERLVANAHGLQEAVGILETVRNRLDPAGSNPLGVDGAPDFPGCGPGGDFVSCAAPSEYLGLLTWRALRPEETAPTEIVEQAADLAVAAWWLVQNDLTNVTAGATSYVHRCGGAAYGMPTWRCDAHMGRPDRDIAGADPYAGPVLFKGPFEFDARRGFYRLAPTKWVEYEVADLDTTVDASPWL